jgi:hypothetical protein
LELTDAGRLSPRPARLKHVLKDPPGADVAQKPFTVANRFGRWCGTLASTATVFTCLGIRP